MGSTLFSAAVFASAPKAYWKLQETAGLPVDSANGLNITSTAGAPTYHSGGVPALGDFSILYNGGDSHTRSSVVSTVTDNLTFEGWIKPISIGANDQVLFYLGNGGSNGWGVFIDSNAKIQALCGGVGFLANSVASLSATLFTHIVVVRRATVWEYYLNGVLDTANAGTTTPGAPSGTTAWGSAALQFAAEHYVVYETALTAATILAHYNAALNTDPGDLARVDRARARRTSW